MSGINFVTTILKIRAPGMRLHAMPMFCWTALASNLLIVAAFPILTATLGMLTLDRYLGLHFFTNEAGGNMMMYRQSDLGVGPSGSLHPGPAGVRRLLRSHLDVFRQAAVRLPLDGVRDAVHLPRLLHRLAAPLLHDGGGCRRQRLFRHRDQHHRGRHRREDLQLDVHDVWRPHPLHDADAVVVGFIVTFMIGGMTGVLLAVPPADFQLHNSLFLVAHFHNVIIAGVLFAAFAGITYWFPKAFGFRLHEGWGKAAFWFTLIGFYVTFIPLYVAGPAGHDAAPAALRFSLWQPWVIVAGLGIVIFSALACQVIQLIVSIRRRDALRDVTGDPWDGRSLEWATPSPPPPFNFAVLPNVQGEEPYWQIKRRAIETQQMSAEPDYKPIEMPRNSPTGFIMAFFATITGFALIWHIWWLVGVGIVAAYAVSSGSPGATWKNTRSRPRRSHGSIATAARPGGLARSACARG